MAISDKMRKLAGLFVELPPSQQTEYVPPANSPYENEPAATPSRTIAEIVREAEGPDLHEIEAATPPVSVAPPDENGQVDFATIYAQAGLPDAPFTAEQTLDMLHGLPANLPLDMKRQTMRVTIDAMGKAIGATPETIVADAGRKLAALAAYSEAAAKQTGEFVAGGEFEIAALLEQVEEKRKALVAAREQQAAIQKRCEAEADRLDDVLEFFSLDIGASKYAPPVAFPASGT